MSAPAPTCYRHPGRETYISCQRCGRPICPDCMVSASVGHQCPTCVKEGAKSTRSGRTPYGGQRVSNPMQTTLVLIGLNVLVWFGVLASGGGNGSVFNAFALLPQTTTFGFTNGTVSTVEGVSGGAYWQLVTSMFTHVSPIHIGFNMLALYVLGPGLENVLGRTRYLALYFLSGLVGSLVVLWLSGEHTQTMGASGAVFGLMGALVVVAFKVKGDLQQILMWIGINIVFTLYAHNSVSWQGHLGGLVGGAAITALIVYAPKKNRATVQWAGMTAILVLTLALAAVRVVALA